MSRLLNSLAHKLGDFHQDSRGWFHFECFRCGKPKLGINMDTMRWRCVRCNKGGTVSDLLQELGIKLEFESAAPRRIIRGPLPTPPGQIEGFVPFRGHAPLAGAAGSPEQLFLKDLLAYVWDRGRMGLPDLEAEGWGYCDRGDDALRLIVPVVVDGQLVSYLARSIYDFLEPKELPGRLKHGWWPREELALGLDDIQEGRPLILVEGMWDRRHLTQCVPGYTTVALLGAHLSAGTCGRILAHRPSRITLMLDGDKAGREGTESALAVLRRRRYPNVHIVWTPVGKDPDDLPAVDAVEMVEQAPAWGAALLRKPRE